MNYNSTTKRTTAVVGAGAVLEFKFSKGATVPTTSNITDAVVNKEYLDSTHKPINGKHPKTDLVKQVYGILKNGFGRDAWRVNFETLFHSLESLLSYQSYLESAEKNIDMMPSNAPLLSPLIKVSSQGISQVMNPYILEIMDIVGRYNIEFQNGTTDSDWYREFWHDYRFWDVFNLNYDTTIEDSLSDYTDGYEDITGYDFMRFNPHKFLQETKQKSALCHPHGCILYGCDSYKSDDVNKDVFTNDFHDFYKYHSYDEARKKYVGTTRNNANTQDGMTIWDSPILTGLRKTDKLNLFPFAYYNSYFNESIQNNNSLLVVGYSFGDTYINEWLQRMVMFHGDKRKIVLIGKWNLIVPISGKTPQDRAHEKRDGLRNYNWDMQINEALTHFLCRASGKNSNDQWIDDLQIEDSTGPMYSTNGCLMLFTDGFKDAAENYKNEIYTFLNS